MPPPPIWMWYHVSLVVNVKAPVKLRFIEPTWKSS